MDDFVGVDGVISAQRLAVLSERTNGPGLIYLVSHWGAIGATGTMMALTWGTWWSVPLFAIQGVLINFLYAPEHECAHYTAFRTRWLNKWVSWVCGFLIFLPSEFHRWTHYAHHRHTQDWEKDTELARPEFVSAWQYLGHLSGVPFVLLRFRNLVSHALGRCTESFLTEPQRRAVIQVARWHVVGYLVVATSAIVMQSCGPSTTGLAPWC